MKMKVLIAALFLTAAQLTPVKSLHAQSKEELQELMSSEPLGTTKSKGKSKVYTTADGEKIKELPDPQSIRFGKSKRLGKQLFDHGSIYNGLKYYEAALSKKPKKTFINQPLADGYFLVRDYARANKYYKTLVELDSVKHKNLFALYQYALTEKYLGNYETSKALFGKFISLSKSNDQFAEQRRNANKEVQGCDLAISFRDSKDLRTYKTQLLSADINQPFTDFSPFLKDPNTFYFGSWVSDKMVLENKREKYATFSRIYKAIKKGNTWGKVEEARGEVNSVQAHTGNASFSTDGNTMYYTQCIQNDMMQMHCDVYKSTHGSNGWAKGEKLSINTDAFTTTQPAVGKNETNEDVLYFASDRNTGKGMDIFYAKINADGSLEKAQALGGSVNTTGD